MVKVFDIKVTRPFKEYCFLKTFVNYVVLFVYDLQSIDYPLFCKKFVNKQLPILCQQLIQEVYSTNIH